MRSTVTALFVSLLSLVSVCAPVRADYKCLCSYVSAEPVQVIPDVESTVIGYLKMFDCKPLARPLPDRNFFAIQFEKKVVYALNSNHISIQECLGDPSPQDLVILATSGSETTVPTTEEPIRTTEEPVHTTLPTVRTTEEPVHTTLPTIRTTEEPVHTTLPTVRTTEEPVRTTLTPVPSTAAISGTSECPSGWVPYRASCYLFRTDPGSHVSWRAANELCGHEGGHLVFIDDIEEKAFIQSHISPNNGHQETIWIGALTLNNVWMWSDPRDGPKEPVNLNIVSLNVVHHGGGHHHPSMTKCGEIFVHRSLSFDNNNCDSLSKYICETQRNMLVVG